MGLDCGEWDDDVHVEHSLRGAHAASVEEGLSSVDGLIPAQFGTDHETCHERHVGDFWRDRRADGQRQVARAGVGRANLRCRTSWRPAAWKRRDVAVDTGRTEEAFLEVRRVIVAWEGAHEEVIRVTEVFETALE